MQKHWGNHFRRKLDDSIWWKWASIQSTTPSIYKYFSEGDLGRFSAMKLLYMFFCFFVCFSEKIIWLSSLLKIDIWNKQMAHLGRFLFILMVFQKGVSVALRSSRLWWDLCKCCNLSNHLILKGGVHQSSPFGPLNVYLCFSESWFVLNVDFSLCMAVHFPNLFFFVDF